MLAKNMECFNFSFPGINFRWIFPFKFPGEIRMKLLVCIVKVNKGKIGYNSIGLKLEAGRPVEGALMPSHSISIIPNRKQSVIDPNRKRPTLHSQTGSTYTLRPQQKNFPLAQQQAQLTETQLSQWEAVITWIFTLFQWIFIFLLLMISLPHPCFYKSLLSCITPQAISLLATVFPWK